MPAFRVAGPGLALAVVGLSVAAGPAQAGDDDALRRLNLSLVDTHVIPGYARLAEATGDLVERTVALCTAAAPDSLAASRQAFHAAMDAWMAVQHLRFGPGELADRPYRIQYWPERRNAIGRQIARLLAAPDESALTPTRFARTSVAGQGLPALERLLFAADAEAQWRTDTADRGRRCALASAIAGNLRSMAAEILQDWRNGPDAYRHMVAGAGAGNRYYYNDREATLDLFKSLHGGLELVGELKLGRPLGQSVNDAKPRRAESWRSRRSLRNIRLNLQALAALYSGGRGYGFDAHVRQVTRDPALAADIVARLDAAQALAATMPEALVDFVGDPAGYQQLVELRRQLDALRALVASRLSVALGIPVGFNALDGD